MPTLEFSSLQRSMSNLSKLKICKKLGRKRTNSDLTALCYKLAPRFDSRLTVHYWSCVQGMVLSSSPHRSNPILLRSKKQTVVFVASIPHFFSTWNKFVITERYIVSLAPQVSASLWVIQSSFWKCSWTKCLFLLQDQLLQCLKCPKSFWRIQNVWQWERDVSITLLFSKLFSAL